MGYQWVFSFGKLLLFGRMFFKEIIISGDPSSYFPGTVMSISEICTLTHTRMGLGSAIFPSKGPMRDE